MPMAISGTQVRYELTASANTSTVHATGGFQIGTPLTTVTYGSTPDVAYSLKMTISEGDTLTLDTATGVVTGTVTGVKQKETATVIAAGGCTSNGDLDLVITAVGLAGSPMTVPVALTTATHTTQDLIAQECRTVLAATTAITDFFAVSGATNTIILEALTAAADDATMNIAIPAALGVSAAASSANTTAGVSSSYASRVSGADWDATDHEGIALPAMPTLFSVLMTSSSETSELTVESATDTIVFTGQFTNLTVSHSGDHSWASDTVDFTAANGDCVVYLDIHSATA